MSEPNEVEFVAEDDYVSEAKESYGEFTLPEEYQDKDDKSSQLDDSLYQNHLQSNWGF